MTARSAAAWKIAVVVAIFTGSVALPGRATASDPLTFTHVVTSGFDNHTVASVHLEGNGMSATDDTVTDGSPGVTFSSLTDDGAGGLNAIITTDAAAPISRYDDITVTPSGGSGVTCTHCIVVYSGLTNNDPPLLLDEKPGDGTVHLIWSLPSDSADPVSWDLTWTTPSGVSAAKSVPLRSDNISGTTGITGLTNGTAYNFTVAPLRGDGYAGRALRFSEKAGTVPDRPTLSASPISPCCEAAFATGSDPNTWTASPDNNMTWKFNLTPLDGGATQHVNQNNPKLQYQEFDRHGYRVTVSATNPIGTSASSTPIVTKPVEIATQIRHPKTRYAHQVFHAIWDPPASDGNSAITKYRVQFGYGPAHGRTIHKTIATTATRVSLVGVKPGWDVGVVVNPVNADGKGEPRSFGGPASLGIVTALDADNQPQWRYDDQGGWHSLGRHFDQPPSVTVSPHGNALFFDSTPTGVAWVRSMTVGWHRLSPETCFNPAGLFSYLGLEIACRSAHHTIETIRDPRREHRLPIVDRRTNPHFDPHEYWNQTGQHIAGALVATGTPNQDGWMAFKTKSFDNAGDNVLAFKDFDLGESPHDYRKLPLACHGPLAASSFDGASFACQTAPHMIAWRTVDSSKPHGGIIHVAERIVGRIGMAGYYSGDDGVICTTDRARVIHVRDFTQHESWRLGTTATPGVEMAAYRG